MNPRLDLNTLIAEKIMGWKKMTFIPTIRGLDWMWSHKEGCLANDAQTVPLYTTDISAAWEVVEKLKTVNPDIYHLSRALKLYLHYQGTGYGWWAEFELENDHAGDDQTCWHAQAPTAPLAICLAALKTTEK